MALQIRDNCHLPKCRERGAVLVLTGFLIFVFVVLIAFVIDLTIVASANEQHRHTAEMAAISALDYYLKTYDGNDLTVDRSNEQVIGDEALLRAQKIAQHTFTLAHGGSELLADTQIGSGGTTGKITFGQWWTSCDPATGCTQICDGPDGTPNQVTPPNCFQSVTLRDANVTSSPIQAVRVNLEYAQPLSARFATMMGYSGYNSQVSAIASRVPMHGVFLVDMSRSMVFETHLNPGQNDNACATLPANSSNFAFQVMGRDTNGDGVGEIDGGCPDTNGDWCVGESTEPDHEYSCGVASTEEDCASKAWRMNLANYRPNATIPFPSGDPGSPIIHYQSDYKCYDVNYEVGGIPTQRSYLIDSYRYLPGGGETDPQYYAGPEPLITVLNGLYYASQQFVNREVSGDMMGALFFESWNDIDVRTFPLIEANASIAAFQQLQDAVNVLNQGALHDATLTYPGNLAKYFTFPRLVNNETPGTQGSATNLYDALTRSLMMLANAPNAAGSFNFVVVVSDGLANCPINDVCHDDYDHWRQSMVDEIIPDLVYGNFIPQNIPIHTVCAGEEVGCNSLNIAVASATCPGDPNPYNIIDDGRRRPQNLPYTYIDPMELDGFMYDSNNDGSPDASANPINEYETRSSANPFFLAPAMLYRISKETNGFYFPLRRVDPVVGSGVCQAPGGTGGYCAANAYTGIQRTCIAQDDPDLLGYLDPSSTNPYMDAFVQPGIIQRFDPFGRTKQKQMREFMDQIFQQNSIVLR